MIEDGVENLIVLAMQSLNITDAIEAEDQASQASSAPSREDSENDEEKGRGAVEAVGGGGGKDKSSKRRFRNLVDDIANQNNADGRELKGTILMSNVGKLFGIAQPVYTSTDC